MLWKVKKKNNNKNWWWKNLYTAEITVLFRVQKEFETLEKKTFEHVEFMKISRDLGKAKKLDAYILRILNFVRNFVWRILKSKKFYFSQRDVWIFNVLEWVNEFICYTKFEKVFNKREKRTHVLIRSSFKIQLLLL